MNDSFEKKLGRLPPRSLSRSVHIHHDHGYIPEMWPWIKSKKPNVLDSSGGVLHVEPTSARACRQDLGFTSRNVRYF